MGVPLIQPGDDIRCGLPQPPSSADFHALLKRHGIRMDKRLGQNFLLETGSIRKIVIAAELSGNENVLEIGAGVGALTVQLADAARQVVAVEIDGRLIPALEEVLFNYGNVRLLQADVLKLDFAACMGSQEFTVVANIPYYITSKLIRTLLELPHPPGRIVLTIQKEVAQRIIARPGQMNLLAVSVQLYGRPRICSHIPAGAFTPSPKVDSTVLRIDMHTEARIPVALIPDYFKVAKAGFSQKRKQLRNSLAAGLAISTQESVALLTSAGIDPQRRPQQLSLEDWTGIAEKWVARTG